jgi:uncharacterized membrane protein (DUF2068 family)
MTNRTARVAPWEDVCLRLIALWKLLNAIFFSAVGVGLLRLRHHNVVEFLNSYIIVPYHINLENPENKLIDWLIGQAGKVTPHALVLLGWTAFIYAALFAIEGVGLFLRKHWAEYLVVIVTGSLLPFEFYHTVHHFLLWKLGLTVGNILIVAYLVHRLVLDARTKSARRTSEGATGAPVTLTARHENVPAGKMP